MVNIPPYLKNISFHICSILSLLLDALAISLGCVFIQKYLVPDQNAGTVNINLHCKFGRKMRSVLSSPFGASCAHSYTLKYAHAHRLASGR